MKDIVLASGSPRRREILSGLGLDFDVYVSEADESSVKPDGISRQVYVQELAMLKASAAASMLSGENVLIIAADTIVSKGNEILGKPRDEEDAKRMLKELSGDCHSVFTGICVMRARDAFSVCGAVETKVYFKEISDEKIERYVKCGEPMDKAGAYGIQGKGALFVEKIEGDYLNVVGLPAARLFEILEDEFGYTVDF